MLSVPIPRLFDALHDSRDDNGNVNIEKLNIALESKSSEATLEYLEKLFEEMRQRNFSMLTATLLEALAMIYMALGDEEKVNQMVLLCKSASYSQFIGNKDILDRSIDLKSMKMTLYHQHESPIGIKCGFISVSNSPLREIELYFCLQAQFVDEIKIDSLILDFLHNESEHIVLNLLKEPMVVTKRQTSFTSSIPKQRPGTLKISSITAKTDDLEIVLPEKEVIGPISCVIKTYDSETDFTCTADPFGICNESYTLGLTSVNLPPDSDLLQVVVAINTEQSGVEIQESPDPQAWTKTIEKPGTDSHQNVVIDVRKPCTITVTIVWTVSYGYEAMNVEKNVVIPFYSAFSLTYKLFSPQRDMISLKSAPKLEKEQKYILVVTAEYNLDFEAEVTQISAKSDSNTSLESLHIGMPINVRQSEAISYVLFLTSHGLEEATSPGFIAIEYKTERSDRLRTSVFRLPLVN